MPFDFTFAENSPVSFSSHEIPSTNQSSENLSLTDSIIQKTVSNNILSTSDSISNENFNTSLLYDIKVEEDCVILKEIVTLSESEIIDSHKNNNIAVAKELNGVLNFKSHKTIQEEIEKRGIKSFKIERANGEVRTFQASHVKISELTDKDTQMIRTAIKVYLCYRQTYIQKHAAESSEGKSEGKHFHHHELQHTYRKPVADIKSVSKQENQSAYAEAQTIEAQEIERSIEMKASENVGKKQKDKQDQNKKLDQDRQTVEHFEQSKEIAKTKSEQEQTNRSELENEIKVSNEEFNNLIDSLLKESSLDDKIINLTYTHLIPNCNERWKGDNRQGVQIDHFISHSVCNRLIAFVNAYKQAG
jgi:hypothetical protein